MDTITDKFKNYLIETGVSKITLKNYMSDISNFSNWLNKTIKTIGAHTNTLTESVPFINASTADEYKAYLSSTTTSTFTINRRLSTLRKLGSFLYEMDVMDYDFTSNLSNISTVKAKNTRVIKTHTELIEFEQYLEAQGVSKNTLKNYSADIRQFLAWADEYLPQ